MFLEIGRLYTDDSFVDRCCLFTAEDPKLNYSRRREISSEWSNLCSVFSDTRAGLSKGRGILFLEGRPNGNFTTISKRRHFYYLVVLGNGVATSQHKVGHFREYWLKTKSVHEWVELLAKTELLGWLLWRHSRKCSPHEQPAWRWTRVQFHTNITHNQL